MQIHTASSSVVSSMQSFARNCASFVFQFIDSAASQLVVIESEGRHRHQQDLRFDLEARQACSFSAGGLLEF